MRLNTSCWQRFVTLFLVLMMVQSAVAQTEPVQAPVADAPPADAGQETQRSSLWAKLFLKNDPLAALQQVTLEDLRKALGDSSLQSDVISKHFSRVTGQPKMKRSHS
jgi:hypothetical protein